MDEASLLVDSKARAILSLPSFNVAGSTLWTQSPATSRASAHEGKTSTSLILDPNKGGLCLAPSKVPMRAVAGIPLSVAHAGDEEANASRKGEEGWPAGLGFGGLADSGGREGIEPMVG